MDILDSVLGREIEAILYSGEKPVNFRWMAEIHIGQETFQTLKVLNYDIHEDPEVDFCPRYVVRLTMEGGTFYKRIFPSDNNVEITLTRFAVREGTSQINYEIPALATRFTASLYNKQDFLNAANVADNLSETVLNTTDLVEVQFTLLHKAIEQLRLFTVGGVYRKSTNEEILKTIMTSAFSRLDLDAAYRPLGVDMVTADNTQTHEQVVIPHGTRVVDIPDFLQNRAMGVYNSGMGSFFKDAYWYVYPKYNFQRFGTTQRTLTVIRVPPNKFTSVERTYRQEGNQIIVLATGESEAVQSAEVHQLNQGNGVRYAHANRMLEDYIKVEGNRATAARGAKTTEFIGHERPNGINIVEVSERKITANVFREYTDITRRQGNVYAFVWENANMELVLPGMLVKILLYQDDAVKEITGTLLANHHSVQLNGQGPAARSYVTRTVLFIFTNALLG